MACGLADIQRSASQLTSLGRCLTNDVRELRKIQQTGGITPSGARLPRVDAEIKALAEASRSIEQARKALASLTKRYRRFETFEAAQR